MLFRYEIRISMRSSEQTPLKSETPEISRRVQENASRNERIMYMLNESPRIGKMLQNLHRKNDIVAGRIERFRHDIPAADLMSPAPGKIRREGRDFNPFTGVPRSSENAQHRSHPTTDIQQATRRRIIERAGRRLKRDGIDGSGIATLMADAGLLTAAAIEEAARQAGADGDDDERQSKRPHLHVGPSTDHQHRGREERNEQDRPHPDAQCVKLQGEEALARALGLLISGAT